MERLIKRNILENSFIFLKTDKNVLNICDYYGILVLIVGGWVSMIPIWEEIWKVKILK